MTGYFNRRFVIVNFHQHAVIGDVDRTNPHRRNAQFLKHKIDLLVIGIGCDQHHTVGPLVPHKSFECSANFGNRFLVEVFNQADGQLIAQFLTSNNGTELNGIYV